MICTLGNFATKLLRDDPAGISRVHGRAEVRTIGAHTTRLYPIFHPAAALYTPRTLETLREDFLGAAGPARAAGGAAARGVRGAARGRGAAARGRAGGGAGSGAGGGGPTPSSWGCSERRRTR